MNALTGILIAWRWLRQRAVASASTRPLENRWKQPTGSEVGVNTIKPAERPYSSMSRTSLPPKYHVVQAAARAGGRP